MGDEWGDSWHVPMKLLQGKATVGDRDYSILLLFLARKALPSNKLA